jgi:hypothetical protein
VSPTRPYFPRQSRVCSRSRRLLPSYALRNANISPILSTLRMLPVATGVSGPRAFLTPRPSFTQSGFREGSLATRHCSFVFSSLPPLFRSLRSFSHPRPLFSIVCRLFSQNTGGGGWLRSQSSQVTSHRSRLTSLGGERLINELRCRSSLLQPRRYPLRRRSYPAGLVAGRPIGFDR